MIPDKDGNTQELIFQNNFQFKPVRIGTFYDGGSPNGLQVVGDLIYKENFIFALHLST